MADQKLMETMRGCEDRLLDALATADVESDHFGKLMGYLSGLHAFIAVMDADKDERKKSMSAMNSLVAPLVFSTNKKSGASETNETPAAEEPKVVELKVVEPESTPAEEPAAEAEPAPEPEIKPQPKPAPKLTKQDMITSLSYYAGDNGGNVDVFAIMQKHGWQNLSGVPAEEYQTLLDEVKAAAGVK